MPAVGEGQIVAQIKDAARAAAAAGTAGTAITGLVDAALRACRRARAQTSISTEGIRAKEFLATKNGGH